MWNGLPVDQGFGVADGLAATNAMTLSGIKAGDNLLAVVSFLPSSGVTVGLDKTDFTVAAGQITAATINLSAAGLRVFALWTNAPAS